MLAMVTFTLDTPLVLTESLSIAFIAWNGSNGEGKGLLTQHIVVPAVFTVPSPVVMPSAEQGLCE